jgi:ionotropic glutamate receptor
VLLGGVFSDHPSRSTSSGDEPAPDNDALLTDEQAFMFAVDFINFEMQSNSFFNFQGLVKTPEYHTKGPFQAMLTTCSLISEHAVAIFGPKEHEDIDIVQSICDHKDIAHVITRWMYKPPYQRSIINFYPHSEYLTSAYFSVLTLWEWKSFTLFYEDNESLLRLGDLLNLAKNSGIVVSVKQLSEEENDVYRQVSIV